MPEGARMKKAALITAIVLLFAVQSLSAVTSRFVLASSVVNRSQTNPAVILNIQATDVSAYVDTGIETSAITDLNLTEDGSITFAEMEFDAAGEYTVVETAAAAQRLHPP